MSRAFPLLEMFRSADQNKQLSNQSVNLEARDAKPILCSHYVQLCNCGASENEAILISVELQKIQRAYLRLLLAGIKCLQKHTHSFDFSYYLDSHNHSPH